MELRVLTGVDQVGQDANNLFALGGLADLVELIKVNNRIHAFGFHKNAGDLTPGAPLVGVAVAFEEAAVGRTAERNEFEGALQNFADPLFYQGGLSSTRWSLDGNSVADSVGVRDPGADHLNNLHLGVIQAINAFIEDSHGTAHVFLAFFFTIFYGNIEFL